MKIEKNYFTTLYNAFGYSPGGKFTYLYGEMYFEIESGADPVIIGELNKLHPMFGVDCIV